MSYACGVSAISSSSVQAKAWHRATRYLRSGRDAPVFSGTLYVTVSGQLIALAEIDRGEIVPKRVFNLAGLQGRAGRPKGV